MLVLSRRPRETIMIGHDIVVTVVSVSGDQVRLGIEAPRHIEVHREEVYRAIKAANEKAAASGTEEEALSGLSALAGRHRAAAATRLGSQGGEGEPKPTGDGRPAEASPGEAHG